MQEFRVALFIYIMTAAGPGDSNSMILLPIYLLLGGGRDLCLTPIAYRFSWKPYTKLELFSRSCQTMFFEFNSVKPIYFKGFVINKRLKRIFVPNWMRGPWI